MHLLFVCTGNICRSPLAERLTTAFAAEALHDRAGELTAESAGVGALVGRPMDPDAALVLTGLGGDPAGFRARALAPSMVARADLVLALDRTHREGVLQQSPRALRKTFTLLEAAAALERLAPGAMPVSGGVEERGAALVTALGRARAGSTGRRSFDVQDPYRRGHEVHEEVGDVIAEALFPLLQTMVGLSTGR